MNRKRLQFKAALCTGIIVTIMLCGCKNAKPVETVSPQSMETTQINEIQIEKDTLPEIKEENNNMDFGYKMWYGEWSVEKKIGENYKFDVQIVSDVIGKTFMFSREKAAFCYYDEEIEIDYPKYKITIIPLDEQTTYFPFMPTLNEMGITGDYVTIFCVEGYDISYILKDDETLIMFYKNAYLELQRVEHIENYEFYYHAF